MCSNELWDDEMVCVPCRWGLLRRAKAQTQFEISWGLHSLALSAMALPIALSRACLGSTCSTTCALSHHSNGIASNQLSSSRNSVQALHATMRTMPASCTPLCTGCWVCLDATAKACMR